MIKTLSIGVLLAICAVIVVRGQGAAVPDTQKLQAMAARILPQSRLELIPFFALAVTAGVCERSCQA